MSSSIRWHWPLDVLHVSDLHFFGDPELDAGRDDAWRALRRDVAQRVRSGQVRPHLLACTGDLVETPSEAGLRKAVNALLELAGDCGFLEAPAVWKEGEERPPDEWWELLHRRVFVVPGNHDVFASGLRVLFSGKHSGKWARITDPQGRVPRGRLEPVPAALAGPLAVRLIDSNGSRAFWKTARGCVDRQIDLAWPAELGVDDRHLRLALVHAHPLQVPFFVQGVFDQEASLMMENAGFLLKNLADLGVRLILHGHRHYPCCYALRLQDSRGATRSVAIVGAGSATKAPSRWPYVSYNWVRLYPDRRTEVRILARDPEGHAFSGFDAPIPATLGDFSCERLTRSVRVVNAFGDLEVVTRLLGLRALAGRPPVRRIPFERRSQPGVELSAKVLRGQAGSRRIGWDVEAGTVELDPPLEAATGAVDLELRYHLHGALALTTWQALQMYGEDGGGREVQRFYVDFEARDIAFQVRFQGRANPALGDRFAARLQRPGAAALRLGPNWDGGKRILSVSLENPTLPVTLELSWPLAEPVAPERGATWSNHWASVRLALREWQRGLLEEVRRQRRPLDAFCSRLAREVRRPELRDLDVALYLPVTSELSAAGETFAGCRLLAVGADPAAAATDESIPFGQGVEGRCHRSGRFLFFHRMKAEDSVRAYREGDPQPPSNFHRNPPGRTYLGYACCPIFPLGMARVVGERLGEVIDARRPESTMLILALGATRLEAFMSWDDRRLGAFFTEVLRELEIRLWTLIDPALSNLFSEAAVPVATAAQAAASSPAAEQEPGADHAAGEAGPA